MTEHGTNEPRPLEVESSTAGATAPGDLEGEMACEELFAPSAELITVACRPFSGYGDNTIPEQLACELQNGHKGLHFAQIQAWGDDEAWAEWGTGASYALPRHFHEETLCPARGEDVEIGEDDTICELPEFHAGAHSFRLRHRYSRGRDMSPENEAKLARLVEEEG